MSARDGTELPYCQKSAVLYAAKIFPSLEGSGYLLQSTDFHQCRAQREYKRNLSKSIGVCTCTKASLQCPASGHFFHWRRSCSSKARPLSASPNNARGAQPSASWQQRARGAYSMDWDQKNKQKRTTHLLLRHEGILSLRDMGSFLEHLAKKRVLPSNS